jgi:hypothetical protein
MKLQGRKMKRIMNYELRIRGCERKRAGNTILLRTLRPFRRSDYLSVMASIKE